MLLQFIVYWSGRSAYIYIHIYVLRYKVNGDDDRLLLLSLVRGGGIYVCFVCFFFFAFFPLLFVFVSLCVGGEKIAERVFIGLPVTGSMRGRWQIRRQRIDFTCAAHGGGGDDPRTRTGNKNEKKNLYTKIKGVRRFRSLPARDNRPIVVYTRVQHLNISPYGQPAVTSRFLLSFFGVHKSSRPVTPDKYTAYRTTVFRANVS